MVSRELIPASWTARLFLIAALTLLGAFARPVAPEAAPVALQPACVLGQDHVAHLDTSPRDAALRDVRGRLAAAALKLSRDGRRARRPDVAPACAPVARPAFSPPDDAQARRHGARAHPATGPPAFPAATV